MEEEKMEKNDLSFVIHPPHWGCSLCRGAGGSQPARLPTARRGGGWSTRCRFVNQRCWSSTMRRLLLPFPGSGSPLLRYFSCSPAPSDMCTLLLSCSVTACFAFLCYIPFCPMFSPWRLRFPSQEFLPSSDLSICSKHYPDALILGPLKTWLFWSCVFWSPSNLKHRYDCESVNLIVKQ